MNSTQVKEHDSALLGTSLRNATPAQMPADRRVRLSRVLFQVGLRSVSITALASALLFALYILAFYVGAAYRGKLADWNAVLPKLYAPDTPAATGAMGLHFVAGAIILLLGGVQFIKVIRTRWPSWHRWIGRVYVTASIAAGLGGLAFISAKGTVGGLPMNIGFALYGLLTVVAATQVWRHAAQRRLVLHRAWAIRLFALAIGSWLFRMEYGFWFIATNKAWHNSSFTGGFDVVMAFFFYLPNLAVAELIVRSDRSKPGPGVQCTAGAILIFAATLIVVGSYYFTKKYWWPAISQWIP